MAEYNGWSNYETWNVNLWLANDEPMYRDVRRLAEQERDDYTPSDEIAAALGERIRDYVQLLVAGGNGTFGDLDTPAEFEAVDWDEIAAAWLEE